MTFVDAFVFLYTYSDMYTPAVTNCRNVMASFIYFGHVPDLAGRALEKLYLVRTHTISHKHIERHILLKKNTCWAACLQHDAFISNSLFDTSRWRVDLIIHDDRHLTSDFMTLGDICSNPSSPSFAILIGDVMWVNNVCVRVCIRIHIYICTYIRMQKEVFTFVFNVCTHTV